MQVQLAPQVLGGFNLPTAVPEFVPTWKKQPDTSIAANVPAPTQEFVLSAQAQSQVTKKDKDDSNPSNWL